MLQVPANSELKPAILLRCLQRQVGLFVAFVRILGRGDLMPPQPVILELQNATSVADGTAIERRISARPKLLRRTLKKAETLLYIRPVGSCSNG